MQMFVFTTVPRVTMRCALPCGLHWFSQLQRRDLPHLLASRISRR